MTSFDYAYLWTSTEVLQIDDIGNFCIKGTNALNFEYYLIVVTKLGWTQVIEYGPIVSDLQQLPRKVNYSYNRLQYKSETIENIVKKFLTDNKKAITKAQEITFQDAKKIIRNMIDYI